MNIVIFTKDFKWAGGVDFLHSLVMGLQTQKEKGVNIFVLVDDVSIKPNLIIRLLNFVRFLPQKFGKKKFELSQNSSTNHQSTFNYIQYIKEIFKNENVNLLYYNCRIPKSLEKNLKKINADVVLPVLFNDFDEYSKYSWIGYLFDFVYKYKPHLYSEKFCLDMDIAFAKTLRNSKSIIVNSQSVANDISKFFPYSLNTKITPLPFAPFINIDSYFKALNCDYVLEKYHITNPFFIVSNQFWLHKDHETAFRAFRNVISTNKYKNVQLLCTGNMTDLSGTNARTLFLEKYIADLGIQVSFLGHIPKIEQMALTLRSVALLQPTTFEGGPGGGSVYMAVACGVHCIVSNIDVNLEIENNAFVHFFKCGDAEDMSEKMFQLLEEPKKFISQNEIIENNERNLQKLGKALLSAIYKVKEQ